MGLFSRRAIGNQYESLAKEYLQRQGLRFIEANFTTKVGEIDLIFK
ncbi:YraN family protein, partial [Vibrio vulnificus]